MRKFIISFFLLNVIISSSFNLLSESPTVHIDELVMKRPFLGGFNSPRTQWVNWDSDLENELFVLDEGGCIRIYDYTTLNSLEESYFDIVETNFGSICDLNWFQIIDIDNDNQLEFVTQLASSSNQIQVYGITGNQLDLIGVVMQDSGLPVLSDSSMVPAFADIDSDGDLDFFTGNIIGTVTFYENIGFDDLGLPIFNLVSFEWQNIWVVGPSFSNRHGASAIEFVDIDSDGDLDLCWGDYFQASLYVIFNNGSIFNPIMDVNNIITEFPYNEPIYTTGRNMPSFNDIDLDGDLDLFISVLGGDGGIQSSDNFLFYENIENSFHLQSTNFMNTIDFNSDVAPELVDIDSDGDLDLFIGQDYNTSTFPIRGRIYFFRNIGNNIYELEDDEFLGTNIGNSLVPQFADIDSDGDLDLFIGNYNGTIIFYKNEGDSLDFNFTYHSELAGLDVGSYSKPSFNDIDSDGDLDLFIGENNGKIYFYKNIGSQFEYNYSLITDSFSNIDVGYRSAPDFIDLNFDGYSELIIGSNNQPVQMYTQNQYQSDYVFKLNECISFPYFGLNAKLDLYYVDDKLMMLTGISTGGLLYSGYESVLDGDINQDNALNIQDIIIIADYIISDSLEIDNCLADLNYDSYIDLFDILYIIIRIVE